MAWLYSSSGCKSLTSTSGFHQTPLKPYYRLNTINLNSAAADLHVGIDGRDTEISQQTLKWVCRRWTHRNQSRTPGRFSCSASWAPLRLRPLPPVSFRVLRHATNSAQGQVPASAILENGWIGPGEESCPPLDQSLRAGVAVRVGCIHSGQG